MCELNLEFYINKKYFNKEIIEFGEIFILQEEAHEEDYFEDDW